MELCALGFSFDTGGRPYQSTSYGAASIATNSVSSITHSGGIKRG